ncbi:hypothetical protein FEM03_18545 [Phragmitibacter flavus]|uniref:DUF7133 domain-containing protein n=1 Tax=Phragmitibacter flavus TaxID=2576071 RepID=A0A5R8KAM4_9BACT|nr:hypothetical protein [Phragmitibacter flavus]TLD69368.1 hypothetical protein FEM03_18545 [Phragmitibacter flavus]
MTTIFEKSASPRDTGFQPVGETGILPVISNDSTSSLSRTTPTSQPGNMPGAPTGFKPVSLFLLILLLLLTLAPQLPAASPSDDYYTVTPYVLPNGLKLEASGLALLPNGKLAVSIRKGEIWILDNPTADPTDPKAVGYRQFATGLHEPLGMFWHEKEQALYTAQRAELTRLRDTNNDGIADEYLTAASGWGVSGNYHEYAYGPAMDRDGNLWITLNTSMGAGVKMPGFRETEKPWRGWAMRLTPDGKFEPMAAGLRSPAGVGTNAEGDVFCTDQQGNWMPTNPLFHLRKGAYFGHADAIPDMARPGSPVKDPSPVPQGITVAEAAKTVPGYALPAIWFPYVKAGQSPTGLTCNTTNGKFGPFDNQLFVAEFVLSGVMRVYLEKVDGEYQGACFNFVSNLQSAGLSLAYLPDGSMVVGESNRGWNSQGIRSFGLERIQWTGKTPFEIQKMEAQPTGFKLTFTQPVDEKIAADPATYAMTSYTYLFHQKYGSDEIDTQPVKITKAQVSEDAFTVHLTCQGLREGYVQELNLPNLRSQSNLPLRRPAAYYTLNKIPK